MGEHHAEQKIGAHLVGLRRLVQRIEQEQPAGGGQAIDLFVGPAFLGVAGDGHQTVFQQLRQRRVDRAKADLLNVAETAVFKGLLDFVAGGVAAGKYA